jgi:uncharacterized phage-associated protein
MPIDTCVPTHFPLGKHGVSTMTRDYLGAVTATASQVAAALREHLPGVEGGKLHRLLYYIQGHHLALHGKPAFTSQITATPDGPEIAGYSGEPGDPPPSPDHDGIHSCAVLVASRYGRLTATDLDRLTKAEDPWQDTPAGGEIGHDLLTAYFRGPGAQDGTEGFTPAYLAKVREEVKRTANRPGGRIDPSTLFAPGGRP